MNAINQDETKVQVLDVQSASGKISSNSFVIIRVLETTDFNQKMTTDFNQYKYHRI